MQVWMKNCLCKQACNTLSYSNQRMAELEQKMNPKHKKVFSILRKCYILNNSWRNMGCIPYKMIAI